LISLCVASDEIGSAEAGDLVNHAGAIMGEALSNVKTAYALNLQSVYKRNYYKANKTVGGRRGKALKSGLTTGASMFVQMVSERSEASRAEP